MTTHQKLQSQRIRRALAVLLLAPVTLALAWADPAPTTTPPSQPASTATTAKPAPTQKVAAKPKATPASAKSSTSTTSSTSASTKAPVVEQLPTVVVIAATRTPQAPDTTATTSTVITRDELEANQYISVPDALMKVPGLSVVQSGVPGQQTSVFIHGMDSNQTLLTIDGRRQPVGLDGAADFTNLTLDNIDQIEVVRTPSSSLEGGNASGGQINLVTLSGRGLAQPISSAYFEGGSYGTYRENVQSRGAVGNFDYAVSGSNEDSDMNRYNENYRNTVYRGNFGYQITPDVYVDVHSGYSLANAGSPNAIEYPDPVARIETQDWYISPEVVAKVADFYTTKLYFNYDQQQQNFHDLFNDFVFNFASSTNLRINTDSVDWQNNLQLAHNWQITAGIQGDDSTVSQFDDFAGRTTLQNSLTNIGGYVESQWEALPGLNVLTSVRDDHYSDFSGAVSWRQGVAYTVAPTQTVLHASGASSYTPPSLEQLYFPGFSNPNLKPETSLGWEAGVAQPFLDGKVTPSVTYFHNHITNYIQDDANFIPQNIGQATTHGFEVDIKAKPIDQLELDVNYTNLTAENDSAGVGLLRRPSNTTNFTATWMPITPLTLSMGGSWIVGRQDVDPVSFQEVAAPNYFTLRASATYKINSYVSLWVRGENITNTQYQPVLGFPALGAAVYGGIKVSF